MLPARCYAAARALAPPLCHAALRCAAAFMPLMPCYDAAYAD